MCFLHKKTVRRTPGGLSYSFLYANKDYIIRQVRRVRFIKHCSEESFWKVNTMEIS